MNFLKRDRQLSLYSRLKPTNPASALANTKPNDNSPKRKDYAAHVSLPSDAIVKQQRVRDDRLKANPPFPKAHLDFEATRLQSST